jgi:hypothetical protein
MVGEEERESSKQTIFTLTWASAQSHHDCDADVMSDVGYGLGSFDDSCANDAHSSAAPSILSSSFFPNLATLLLSFRQFINLTQTACECLRSSMRSQK